MTCVKFCDDVTKRVEKVKWYQETNWGGPNWERDYRLAMFQLAGDSDYEAIELFVNLKEYNFKKKILINSGNKIEWGSCGETIFLVRHDADNDIPRKRFCELYYYDGGQVSNELVKKLPSKINCQLVPSLLQKTYGCT